MSAEAHVWRRAPQWQCTERGSQLRTPQRQCAERAPDCGRVSGSARIPRRLHTCCTPAAPRPPHVWPHASGSPLPRASGGSPPPQHPPAHLRLPAPATSARTPPAARPRNIRPHTSGCSLSGELRTWPLGVVSCSVVGAGDRWAGAFGADEGMGRLDGRSPHSTRTDTRATHCPRAATTTRPCRRPRRAVPKNRVRSPGGPGTPASVRPASDHRHPGRLSLAWTTSARVRHPCVRRPPRQTTIGIPSPPRSRRARPLRA